MRGGGGGGGDFGAAVMKQRIISYQYSPRVTGHVVTAQNSAECCLAFAHWAIECCIGCLESAHPPPSEPGRQLASTSTTTTTQPPPPSGLGGGHEQRTLSSHIPP